MGIETYPVVEGQDENALFLTAEWKWVTDCIEKLDTTAEALGLVPLGNFHSYSRQDAIDSLSEEEVEEMEEEAEFKDGWFVQGESKLWSLERQWFEPDEALRTTQSLRQYLQAHPERLDKERDEDEGFPYILEELEKVLVEVKANNKRFHLKGCV